MVTPLNIHLIANHPKLMSGVTLHLSEKMYEGDDVRFSDGTSGNIEKMGWFETMIRNSDELVVGIPNTEVRYKYTQLHCAVMFLCCDCTSHFVFHLS